MKIKKAMLVYQGGIANVFAVDAIALSAVDRKHTERLLQYDFRSCEMFASGLQAAGVTVWTAACNQAGDIEKADWTYDLEAQPFSHKFHPVGINAADFQVVR